VKCRSNITFKASENQLREVLADIIKLHGHKRPEPKRIGLYKDENNHIKSQWIEVWNFQFLGCYIWIRDVDSNNLYTVRMKGGDIIERPRWPRNTGENGETITISDIVEKWI